jgi:hypothetical protein
MKNKRRDFQRQNEPARDMSRDRGALAAAGHLALQSINRTAIIYLFHRAACKNLFYLS